MDTDQPTGTEADVGDDEVPIPRVTTDTGDGPEVRSSTPRITVTFRAQDGVEVPFQMEKSAKFGRAMDIFHEQTNRLGAHFYFEGQRILANTTPLELEMDGDEIVDAYEADVPRFMTLYFRKENGVQMPVKMMSTRTLGKYMADFVKAVGHPCRFIFEGVRVVKDTTPDSLGLDDNEVIEAFEETIGGVGAIGSARWI